MAKEEKVQNPEEVKSEEKVQEEPQASKKEQKKEIKKVEELEKKLAESEKKVEELETRCKEAKDDYIRLMAEFETFRRRSAEDRLSLVGNASAETIQSTATPHVKFVSNAFAASKTVPSSTNAIDFASCHDVMNAGKSQTSSGGMLEMT